MNDWLMIRTHGLVFQPLPVLCFCLQAADDELQRLNLFSDLSGELLVKLRVVLAHSKEKNVLKFNPKITIDTEEAREKPWLVRWLYIITLFSKLFLACNYCEVIYEEVSQNVSRYHLVVIIYQRFCFILPRLTRCWKRKKSKVDIGIFTIDHIFKSPTYVK